MHKYKKSLLKEVVSEELHELSYFLKKYDPKQYQLDYFTIKTLDFITDRLNDWLGSHPQCFTQKLHYRTKTKLVNYFVKYKVLSMFEFLESPAITIGVNLLIRLKHFTGEDFSRFDKFIEPHFPHVGPVPILRQVPVPILRQGRVENLSQI